MNDGGGDKANVSGVLKSLTDKVEEQNEPIAAAPDLHRCRRRYHLSRPRSLIR